MGEEAHGLYRDILLRVQAAVERDHGAAPLYSAGSLLTRIWATDRVPNDGMDVEPGMSLSIYAWIHISKCI